MVLTLRSSIQGPHPAASSTTGAPRLDHPDKWPRLIRFEKPVTTLRSLANFYGIVSKATNRKKSALVIQEIGLFYSSGPKTLSENASFGVRALPHCAAKPLRSGSPPLTLTPSQHLLPMLRVRPLTCLTGTSPLRLRFALPRWFLLTGAVLGVRFAEGATGGPFFSHGSFLSEGPGSAGP